MRAYLMQEGEAAGCPMGYLQPLRPLQGCGAAKGGAMHMLRLALGGCQQALQATLLLQNGVAMNH